MLKNLPKKLEKQPVIEAIFEMRFQTDVPASNILLGIFFAKIKDLKVEKLPEIPQPIRDHNPYFRYSPQFRLSWNDYSILLGDSVFAIVSGLHYEGWINFKKIVLELVNIIQEANLPLIIERYSLKYVDLIQTYSIKEQLNLLNFDLKLGSRKISTEAVNVRIEIPQDKLIHIIQIISNGFIENKEEGRKDGILINIDSISNGPHSNFWTELSTDLEKAHEEGKNLFFDFLKTETLNNLEPIYD